MKVIFLIYNFIYPIVIFLMKLSAPFHPKLQRFIQARSSQNNTSPWDISGMENCILIHAASGEFEYAKPVIRELLKRKEKILVTYYSPSYESQIKAFPGITSCPLPWDRPHIIKYFLGRVRPKAILITRTDLWYNFLKISNGLMIPIFLFSATLNKDSSKIKNPFIKKYYQYLFQFLTQVYAVSYEDQSQIQNEFLFQNTISVGDTRYDQVQYRIKNPKSIKDELAFSNEKQTGSPIFIAGSTWPEDELKICKASKTLISKSIRVAIAPHEPTESHLEQLENTLKKFQIPHVRYSKTSHWPAHSVLIVDQLGILADLYKWANWAFVGGSFKKQVHSVMEPLAHGCYTFVGPFHINNREAVEFQKVLIPSRGQDITPVMSFQKSQDLVDAILKTHKTDLLDILKDSIQELVRSRTGASYELVEDLLKSVGKRN